MGGGTARALADAGIAVDVTGSGDALDLAKELAVKPGCRVLFPCAEGAGAALPDALAAKGAKVERVVLYRTKAAEGPVDPPAAREVRVYGSPSAVQVAATLGWEADPNGVRRVAMGETTASELEARKLAHVRNSGSGPDAVIAALLDLSKAKDSK